MFSGIKKIFKKVDLKTNNYYQVFLNYGSEVKKAPHQSKQKEAWIKTNVKSNTSNVKKTNTILNLSERKIIDPVWIMGEYEAQKYNFDQIIDFHKELAQESMLNNIDTFVSAKFLIDMKGKKKGKFIDSIKINVKYPTDFTDGIKKEIIAICKNENEMKAAKEAGALFVGHEDVLKKLQSGEITDASFDVIVCTPETLQDINAIKKKINKDRLPSLKSKTVGANIFELVSYHRLSKTYESNKIEEETSTLKANIGFLSMNYEILEANLKELISSINIANKYDTENFIKMCKIYCPPSTESFLLDFSKYETKVKKSEAVEEEEDEEE